MKIKESLLGELVLKVAVEILTIIGEDIKLYLDLG